MAVRGRLKRSNNSVDFTNRKSDYRKYFIDHEQVKNKLESFFMMWNDIPGNSEAMIFARFVILQTELISIHAFNDGNGRVSRALAESYFERQGFVPYTPYSVDHKRSYQKAIGDYSIISLSNKQDAYLYLAKFILNQYEKNTKELITSFEKLLKSVEKRYNIVVKILTYRIYGTYILTIGSIFRQSELYTTYITNVLKAKHSQIY